MKINELDAKTVSKTAEKLNQIKADTDASLNKLDRGIKTYGKRDPLPKQIKIVNPEPNTIPPELAGNVQGPTVSGHKKMLSTAADVANKIVNDLKDRAEHDQDKAVPAMRESIAQLDEISRRDFLKGMGAAALGAAMPSIASADERIIFSNKSGSVTVEVTPKGVLMKTSKPLKSRILVGTIDGESIELEQDNPQQYHDRYASWKSILPNKNKFDLQLGNSVITLEKVK